jgi:hypothetical protein
MVMFFKILFFTMLKIFFKINKKSQKFKFETAAWNFSSTTIF